MNKSDIKQSSKEQIDQIFQKVETLEQKKDEVMDSSREAFEEQIQKLKNHKEELTNKYQKLSDASEQEWEHAKLDFNQSMDSFQTGISRLADMFSAN